MTELFRVNKNGCSHPLPKEDYVKALELCGDIEVKFKSLKILLYGVIGQELLHDFEKAENDVLNWLNEIECHLCEHLDRY